MAIRWNKLVAVCVLCVFCGYSAFTQANYSLIKGTVFTAEGRSFAGAKVTVIRADIDEKQQKKSRREAVSDRLGEFAFRLAVGPAKFHLTVEAPGFPKQEKDVQISGDERTDVTIILKK
jgi:carboxypeptidase family protein